MPQRPCTDLKADVYGMGSKAKTAAEALRLQKTTSASQVK